MIKLREFYVVTFNGPYIIYKNHINYDIYVIIWFLLIMYGTFNVT